MKTVLRFPLLAVVVLTNMKPLLAQWTQSNLPTTGGVSALTVLGASIIAGTDGDGVFRSTDDGVTWSARNSGLTNLNVLSLAVSTTNLFAGTNGGGSVFRSTNSGASWVNCNLGGGTASVSALAVSSTNLFAGSNNATYRSTNNGVNWLNAGLFDVHVRDLAVLGENLFAGTEAQGVHLSTNNGATWTPVNSGLSNADVYALVVSGTDLFAGTFGGVFLSSDTGRSWTERNSGLTNPNVLSLAISGTNLFAGTFGGGVFLSTNNGTSWAAVNSGLTNAYVHALAVFGTNLFAGSDSGAVWKRPLSEMITSVEVPSINLPGHFALSQNYPNPFNPVTVIPFTLHRSLFTTLRIYNALGQEVAVLVDEELGAGSYRISWYASGFPSGVYFYRLQAGEFIETKKLVLLR